MLSSTFTIRDEFPPVDYDRWRELVEADLKGASFEKKLVTHTYEGIDIRPIYAPQDFPGGDDPHGFPGTAPFVRGSSTLGTTITGIDLRQEHAHPDLETTNQAILADLAGGVTSLLLRLDPTACDGRDVDLANTTDPASQDGLLAYSVDNLDVALDDVHLEMIGVALESGAAFLPAAALLAALWQRRGIAPAQARGAFNADPLAVLAREGELPQSPEAALSLLGDLAQWTSQHCPHLTSVAIDTSPYHLAGATAAQDLAFGLATGVVYLRAMTDAGLDVDAAIGQILLRMSLGTHHFLAIAKLRAARRLWGQVVEACGGSESAAAPKIHARTSDRVLTRRDPYVNILRNSVSAFAACVAGAEVVTSVPFDQTVGLPDELSRRVARNTLHILQEEAHLHRVIDPAGGSWFLETVTDQLAERSLEYFSRGRATGRYVGRVAEWLGGSADRLRLQPAGQRHRPSERRDHRRQRISQHRRAALVAYTARPSAHCGRRRPTECGTLRKPSRPPLEFASAESKTAAARRGKLPRAPRLVSWPRVLAFTRRPCRSSRSKREVSRSLLKNSATRPTSGRPTQGRRPRVFLANMGPVAHHTARATYAKNFFEAGGFEVATNDGFQQDVAAAAAAFRESGASIGVICSSDKLYPVLVPKVAGELRAAGARSVVLAGNPGDMQAAWRDAGVDRFIYHEVRRACHVARNAARGRRADDMTTIPDFTKVPLNAANESPCEQAGLDRPGQRVAAGELVADPGKDFHRAALLRG